MAKRRLLGDRPINACAEYTKAEHRRQKRVQTAVDMGRAVRMIEQANSFLTEKVAGEPSVDHMRQVIEEFACGDLGASSAAIACSSVGILERANWPIDPDDLLRCMELLRKYPWMREPAFAALKNAKHTPWPQLIHHWDQLTAMLTEEVCTSSNCNKTYLAMKNLGC